jgi:hypothetical protein
MLFALFEEHDGDTVFDRVTKPIAAIDEPFFAIGIDLCRPGQPK